MTIGSLGYVGFKADDLDAWAKFGTEILGMMPVEAPDGTLRFRIDAQGWRVCVEPGPENDIGFVGFEVAGPAELAALQARLVAAGVAVSQPSPEHLKVRVVMFLL